MAQQGRNERCPCGSGRKAKHCCGVRRGPSEAELAKAWLHQQARSAALVLAARSDDEVVALVDAATLLPRQDVSMQLPLPRLLSPALERLRAAIAEDDPGEVEVAVPAALAEVDTRSCGLGWSGRCWDCGTPGGCQTRSLRRWRSSRPAARPRCCAPACWRRWRSASGRPPRRLGCWWSAGREPPQPVCGHADHHRAAGAAGQGAQAHCHPA
jgi:hypothetical protein